MQLADAAFNAVRDDPQMLDLLVNYYVDFLESILSMHNMDTRLFTSQVFNNPSAIRYNRLDLENLKVDNTSWYSRKPNTPYEALARNKRSKSSARSRSRAKSKSKQPEFSKTKSKKEETSQKLDLNDEMSYEEVKQEMAAYKPKLKQT